MYRLTTLSILAVSVAVGCGRRDTPSDFPPIMSFEQSKYRAVEAQLDAFTTQLEIFTGDVGRLPTDTEGLASLHTRPTGVEGWNGPYAQRAIPSDPWGHPYVFRREGESYDLHSMGPDGMDGTEDDIRRKD